jgi:hypothetical protein
VSFGFVLRVLYFVGLRHHSCSSLFFFAAAPSVFSSRFIVAGNVDRRRRWLSIALAVLGRVLPGHMIAWMLVRGLRGGRLLFAYFVASPVHLLLAVSHAIGVAVSWYLKGMGGKASGAIDDVLSIAVLLLS